MDVLFCYHLVLMLMASLAVVLLTIGYATPGWLLVTFDESLTQEMYTVSSLNKSLWYDIHCPWELLDCRTCAYTDSDDCVQDMAFVGYSSHYEWVKSVSAENDKDKWLVWRILQTIVMGTALFGYCLVITLVCCLLHPTNYRIICTIGCVIWFIAGLVVWPVVAMVADLHMDIKDEINNNLFHDASLDIPYSLVLSAFGGLFALITAIMLLWLTGVCRADEDETSTTLVSEHRSKLTGIRRSTGYYGPYPYYSQERPTEYREAPARYIREYSTKDHSSTTEDEFYVVQDSPYYVPAYYDAYYGTDLYDNNRRIDLASQLSSRPPTSFLGRPPTSFLGPR